MTETGQTDCGCPDWRTDADLDTDFASDASNVFPTGLFPEEHAPKLKAELDRAAEQAEADRAWAAARAARAKAQARFTTEATNNTETTQDTRPTPDPDPRPEHPSEPDPGSEPPPQPERPSEPTRTAAGAALGPPPYLPRPPREAPTAGKRAHQRSPNPTRGARALSHARTRHTNPKPPPPIRRRPVELRPHPARMTASNPDHPSTLTASSNADSIRPDNRTRYPSSPCLIVGAA
ncbi:hypothetical protein GCM10029992_02790 [Glycomyces albus]